MSVIEVYYEKHNKKYRLSSLALNITDWKSVSALLNEKRLRILDILQKHPRLTAGEISSLLGEDIFSVYYHLRILEKHSLVNVEEIRMKKNLVQKKYSINFDAFLLLMHEGEEKKEETSSKKAVIVVGSPDNHGKFNLRARDGYLTGFISYFLGKKGWEVDILLDTWFDEEDMKDIDAVFVMGGPLTNMLAYEINSSLRIRYDDRIHFRGIVSYVTNNQYTEENLSLIGKVEKNGVVYVILSGITLLATELSIKAFTHLYEDILFTPKRSVIYVVEGLDRDSDGKIEDFRIIEKYVE